MNKTKNTKLIDEILTLNENAYIYRKTKQIDYKNHRISDLFTSISSKKLKGRYLLREVNRKFDFDGEEVKLSCCIFRYPLKPSILSEHVEGWEEIKIGYIFLVELKDYVVIAKKNVGAITKHLKELELLDYSLLSSLFVDDDTKFEKLQMSNLNASDSAMRNKTVESLDLKSNMSTNGVNSYSLNNIRLKNSDGAVTIALSSSRINKFGDRKVITAFIEWCISTVYTIDSFVPKQNFLNAFATPVDYETHRHLLEPISILFNFSNIYEDFDRSLIAGFYYESKIDDEVITREIDLISELSKLERLSSISIDKNDRYSVRSPHVTDLIVSMNRSSITVKSQKLKKIFIRFANGEDQNLLDYINGKQAYQINFEDAEVTYSKRKLFKDNRLLGSIESFLDVFKPVPELAKSNSEKGVFTADHKKFDSDSVFGIVEDEIICGYPYVVCDDLGKEWADHIALKSDKVVFVHSKSKSSKFSASDFQDVVGQALKNIGVMLPLPYMLESKENVWSSFYKNDKVITQIKRIRTGQSVKDFSDFFSSVSKTINLEREIFLVVDFLSKKQLTDNLEKLKNSKNFARRNETIQMLWLLNQLIGTCIDQNVKVQIYCKE